MSIAQNVMDRLALVRYVASQSVEQARLPDPLKSTAVLSLHDAVELFLDLASQQPGVIFGIKNPNFLQYWQMQLPQGKLTQQASMEKLNKVRVAFKHHGIIPHAQDIAELQALASLFFEENTPLVFGIAFDEISMTNLVHIASVRERLKQAETLMAAGQQLEAIDEIAIAFERLMKYFDNLKEARFRRPGRNFPSWSQIHSKFRFNRSMVGRSQFGSPQEIAAMLNTVAEAVNGLQTQIAAVQAVAHILSLGLSYTRYVRFSILTPHVTTYIASNEEGAIHKAQRSAKFNTTKDNCHYCLHFVVEAALQVQAFTAATRKE